MVLLHTHSFSRVSSLHLDIARIVACSGAIALNVVVLLLLLIPAGLPDLATQPDRPTFFVPIAEKVTPPPTPPPEEVEVVAPRTPVAQVPVQQEIVRPVVEQVVVDQGTLPAKTIVAPPARTGPVDIAPPPGPVEGVRLEYANASSPPYPRDALRAGHEGTVLLRVLVGVDGRPLQVDIERSSGHRRLDDAARRHVLRHWTFRPALKDGLPVQAVGIVPVDFSLG